MAQLTDAYMHLSALVSEVQMDFNNSFQVHLVRLTEA